MRSIEELYNSLFPQKSKEENRKLEEKNKGGDANVTEEEQRRKIESGEMEKQLREEIEKKMREDIEKERQNEELRRRIEEEVKEKLAKEAEKEAEKAEKKGE